MATRLWSLRDMFELEAGNFLAAHALLNSTFQHLLDRERAAHLAEPPRLAVSQIDMLTRSVRSVLASSRQMELPATSFHAQNLITVLESLQVNQNGVVEFDEGSMIRVRVSAGRLVDTMTAETNSRWFLCLSALEASLLKPQEPIFAPIVSSQFASASYDITEAVKCLALERSTAAVFHLMRVVERALRAVNFCLGLSVPSVPSWGVWLNGIRLERERRGLRQWSESRFFQEVWQHLDAIKEVYRDPTLHVETIHTSEEARLILDNVKVLMRKIASRMDENGDPKSPP